MKRKIGIALIAAGTALVVAALSLYAFQLWKEKEAGDAADDALLQVKAEIGAVENNDTDRDAGTDAEMASEAETEELPVVTVDGWDYIGYLSVPSLGLELPVMSEWSYEGLDIAPGRFSGSLATNNLVIAGHNYRRHFSSLKSLSAGDLIVFTDMAGNAYYYEVSRLETLQPAQVEEMEGLVGDDDWDMTLFTCTSGGTARCAIRCILSGV
ncbi:MAG: sortase [Clostridiales bacterium]|nr:sortase [Clostridiales bacterium]